MEQDSRDPLIEEALRWLVVLRDETVSESDRQGFAHWLAGGPAHAAAWQRAQSVWSQLDALEPAMRASRANVVVMPGSSTPHPVAQGLSRRQWLAGAAAASMAVAAGYAFTHPGLFATHRTGIGERRSVTLADGSIAELGSASSLSVEFDDRRRAVTLHDGEAFFTVAPDAGRAFVVTAANGQTEALGTAFNVKKLGDMVAVSVSEHAVAVTAGGHGAVEVAEGQQVRYGPHGIESASAVDLRAVQAWRRDRLVFHESPLGDVVADLERYRHGRILITDGRISKLPVTAVIDARQTDAALRTIGDTLPVTVRRLSDLLVLISPAG
jgi:transmembrane sensor